MLGKTIVDRAIFGTSIEESRTKLIETVWPKQDGLFTDQMIIDCIKRREDVSQVRTLILSGELSRHERINTVEKLALFLADIQGPSLQEAMTLNIQMLSKLNYNLSAVPLTENERQIKQMQDHFYERNDERNDEIRRSTVSGSGSIGSVNPQHHYYWPCIFPQVFQTPSLYTWYRAVWYRVNLSFLFVSQEKACVYANAHLPQIRYLDSLRDPLDAVIDVSKMQYTPIRGAATINENIDHFKREVIWRQVKQTPLQYLQEHFPDKRWTIESILEHDRKALMLEDPFLDDDDGWVPISPNDAPFATHSIYRACVFLANQTRKLGEELRGEELRGVLGEKSKETKDYLWIYYVSLVDFFSYVSMCDNPREQASDVYLLTPSGSTVNRNKEANYSAKLTPWEMYGSHLDVRTKHAGDLPDIFHLINTIPLAGEQCTPTTRLGKIYQKCLPFACQRRLIIDLIVDTIQSDDAFSNLCAQLFWVMLAGLYPGDDRTGLTMRDLMRAKQLVQTKESLISMLQPPVGSACKNGAPLVVFTAFRLHIIYMASLNPTYVECARECIDWDNFVENTKESAALIRSSDLIPEDPFERARTKMIKTIKNSNARVSRIRRRSLAVTLTKESNEVLEKLIFKDYFSNRNEPFYARIFSIQCKSNITNFLLRLPASERFTHNSYSVLTLSEYGGVSLATVELMDALTTVYCTSNGMPKDFARVIDQFDVRDFIVVCYYFNIATELERISFIALDSETIRRTDAAIISKKRYNLYPGQRLPDDIYNIHIALCCGRICTLMGQGKFGAKAVAYDMEKQCFVCSKGKLSHKKNKLGADRNREAEEDEDDEEEYDIDEDIEEEDDDEEEDFAEAQNDHIDPIENLLLGGLDLVSDAVKQNGRGTKRSAEMSNRKAIRTERKRFNRVPCGQPVLTIPLRGRALIWGNTGEKQKQYMFCPQCGAFHVYSIFNFSGAVDGLYRCTECAAKETGHREYTCCAYCKREPFNTIDVPNPTLERYYFCKNHYQMAKKWQHKCTSKDMLWKIIAKIEHKRKMKNQ